MHESASGTKRTCRVALHTSAFGGSRLDITNVRLSSASTGLSARRFRPTVAAGALARAAATHVLRRRASGHRSKCYPADYPERHFPS